MTLTRADIVNAAYAELREHRFAARWCQARAEQIADRLGLTDVPRVLQPTSDSYDLRAEQDFIYPHGRRKAKKIGGKVVMRNPEDVDTVTLHQTAVPFGLARYQIDAAQGNERLALARRGLDVACHAIAFEHCHALTSPLLAYIYHANRGSARSVGLEIEGLFPGLEDDPTTVRREDLLTTWRRREPTVWTPERRDQACMALNKLVTAAAEENITIRYIDAHRQWNGGKPTDPGQSIWRDVALGYAVPKLGLEVRHGAWHGGRPIPREWDPSQTVGY